METKRAEAALLSALILAASSFCGAEGFKAMAKELSNAAKAAGIGRVAVLPFSSPGGAGSGDGQNVSETLMTQVVRLGKVQVVERSLLRDLMEENHLGQTGMIDPSMRKKIGRIFSVDAIITGSFMISGQKITVNARLVDVETGVIISASDKQVDPQWDPAATASSARENVFNVPVPELFVAAPPAPTDASQPRDATDDDSCEGSSERVDELESEILDLKARYWAGQLKQGVSLSSLKVNPGSEITDPILKRSFYEKLEYWYELADAPTLTPAEVRRFVSIDGKAYSLSLKCGV